MEKYIKLNKQTWDNKTEAHLVSEFYDNKSFIDGKNSLNKPELELIGDVKGKSILHLQCHFGQDTISLSRLGANTTGVDFSSKSIQKAKELAKLVKSNTQFIESNIYDLKDVLSDKFDIVFTSYGTIGWLKDLDKWADIISNFLKADGRFIMVDFHPFIWMYDDNLNHYQYSYFNEEEIEEKYEGSYTDSSQKVINHTISFNHPISEILNSLINSDLELEIFNEYNYSPYNVFKGMIEDRNGEFIVEKFGRKFPLLYGIEAKKKKN